MTHAPQGLEPQPPLTVYLRGGDPSLPNGFRSLFTTVLAELEGKDIPEWRRSLILKLAESINAAPRAANIRELRLMLTNVERTTPAADVADELQKRRTSRRKAPAPTPSAPSSPDRRGGRSDVDACGDSILGGDGVVG